MYRTRSLGAITRSLEAITRSLGAITGSLCKTRDVNQFLKIVK